MAISMADEGVLAAKFAVMRPFLDERAWRVYLGTEADALGYGGGAAGAPGVGDVAGHGGGRAGRGPGPGGAGAAGAGPVPPARRRPAESGGPAARLKGRAGRAAGRGPAW